ncbi:MAG: DUF4412 domain-containing protein [Bacteroidota bacterium]|nr:DUF4412 domain-containing protein [Candidatus Kapabacteria bacterium]MDW8219941.1 DUF4412 domain-containing protein [Bacteroidota bacterium]
MKASFLLLIVCSYALFTGSPTLLLSQKTANFEGVVVFKKKGETHGVVDSVTMRLYIKGDKFMAEDVNDVNQPRIIVDTKKKAIFMVTDRSREYIQMPMPSPPPTTPAKPPIKFPDQQTIAGYTCDHWIDKSSELESELWTSAELGKLSLPSGQMGVNLISSNNMATFLKNSGLFPLLFIEKNKAGREITRLEVISVDRKNLSDAVFEPPQGYTKMASTTGILSDEPQDPKKKKK